MLFYETTRRSAAFALSFQATSLTKADSVARCLKTISYSEKMSLCFHPRWNGRPGAEVKPKKIINYHPAICLWENTLNHHEGFLSSTLTVQVHRKI